MGQRYISPGFDVTSDATDYRRLIDIGRALSAERDIDSLMERILREAKSMVNADAGTLYLVTAERALQFTIVLNDTLSIAQGGKTGTPVSLPEVPLRLDDDSPNLRNIASRAACTGQTIVIDDVYSATGVDTTGTRHFDELTGYRSKSFLTVPLKNFRDEPIGVLQLLNRLDEQGEIVAFPEDCRSLIESLAAQAAIVLTNKQLLEEQEMLKRQLEREVEERTAELQGALEKLSEAHIILKELTTIDPVTGIRNRQYFDEVFEQEWRRALRQQYPVTLMVLDIDHFKSVNDTYGHLAGDECLAAVAREIDSSFNRPSDVVARFGGEEFVVILPYVEYQNALQLGDQVRKRLSEREILADGHSIGITVSIGTATIVPTDKTTPKQLLSQADEALYRAKARGRNMVVGAEDGG